MFQILSWPKKVLKTTLSNIISGTIHIHIGIIRQIKQQKYTNLQFFFFFLYFHIYLDIFHPSEKFGFMWGFCLLWFNNLGKKEIVQIVADMLLTAQ